MRSNSTSDHENPKDPIRFFDQILDGIDLKRLTRDDSAHLRILGLDLFESRQIAGRASLGLGTILVG